MKILNKIICLTLFLVVGSVSARVGGIPGQQPQRQVPNVPVLPPAPQLQPGQQITYKQLHNAILSEGSRGMFDGNMFSKAFIDRTIANAQKADIGKEGLRALLQTARDKWLTFTGNDADDLGILKAINVQIDAAVATMQ